MPRGRTFRIKFVSIGGSVAEDLMAWEQWRASPDQQGTKQGPLAVKKLGLPDHGQTPSDGRSGSS